MMTSNLDRMRRGAIHGKLPVCATLLLLLPVGVLGQPSKDAKKTFEAAYKNRTVTLKKTLCTIAATVTFTARPQVLTRGTLVLTPDKGAYHSAFFGEKLLRDRDPDQLLQKGAAETQSISSGGPKLFKYEPPTRMRLEVTLSDKGVMALLYDELAEPDEPTTSIQIEWPEKFSKNFDERVQVELLLKEYLDIQ